MMWWLRNIARRILAKQTPPPILIMRALKDAAEPMYAMDIVAVYPDHLRLSTIFPHLSNLEIVGFIGSERGDLGEVRRRLYHITTTGLTYLATWEKDHL